MHHSAARYLTFPHSSLSPPMQLYFFLCCQLYVPPTLLRKRWSVAIIMGGRISRILSKNLKLWTERWIFQKHSDFGFRIMVEIPNQSRNCQYFALCSKFSNFTLLVVLSHWIPFWHDLPFRKSIRAEAIKFCFEVVVFVCFFFFDFSSPTCMISGCLSLKSYGQKNGNRQKWNPGLKRNYR